MSITIQNSIMVRPSKETPNEAIWLTDVDLIKRTPYSHTPFVYFYPYHKNNSNNNNSTFSNFFDSTFLKTSLSEVLVAFYPVAGRLRRNNVTGRIEIDCNAKGVLFVEAKTTSFELSDLGEFTPIDMLYKLLIPSCDYSGDLANIPLMMVQLTRFRCGGICIGLGVHHFVGDGTAYIYLVSQWARLTRGVGLAALPVFDRASILSPRRQPPQLMFDHIEFQRHHTPRRRAFGNNQGNPAEVQNRLQQFRDLDVSLRKFPSCLGEKIYPATHIVGEIPKSVKKHKALISTSTSISGRTRNKLDTGLIQKMIEQPAKKKAKVSKALVRLIGGDENKKIREEFKEKEKVTEEKRKEKEMDTDLIIPDPLPHVETEVSTRSADDPLPNQRSNRITGFDPEDILNVALADDDDSFELGADLLTDFHHQLNRSFVAKMPALSRKSLGLALKSIKVGIAANHLTDQMAYEHTKMSKQLQQEQEQNQKFFAEIEELGRLGANYKVALNLKDDEIKSQAEQIKSQAEQISLLVAENKKIEANLEVVKDKMESTANYCYRLGKVHAFKMSEEEKAAWDQEEEEKRLKADYEDDSEASSKSSSSSGTADHAA